MPKISDERVQYYIIRQIYEKNRTQKEIADFFNLEYSTVRRHIEKAKEKKFVTFTFHPPKIPELEETICKELGLRDCFIAELSDPSDKKKVLNDLGKTAGWYIDRMLKEKSIITIGGGNTLWNLVNAFNPKKPKEKRFVEICTLNTDTKLGLWQPPIYKSSFIASQLSSIFMQDKNFEISQYNFDLKEPIISQKRKQECPICKEVLEKIRASDIIIFGIGFLKKGTASTFSKILNDYNIDIEELLVKKIVGDVAFNAVTEEGDTFSTGLEEFIIFPGKEDIKKISTRKGPFFVIGIAEGTERIRPIIGAAKAKLINTLITDEKTAEALLAYLEGRKKL